MLLEEMMDDIIKKYGFEAKETIQFCHDCEVAKRKIATIIEKCYLNEGTIFFIFLFIHFLSPFQIKSASIFSM